MFGSEFSPRVEEEVNIANADTFGFQSVVDCDSLKEPDILLLLTAPGLSVDFRFPRLCPVYFKVDPLNSVGLDKHRYAPDWDKGVRQICLDV